MTQPRKRHTKNGDRETPFFTGRKRRKIGKRFSAARALRRQQRASRAANR